ncbi:MAG: hypothetical protein M3Q68_01655 [Actinomycetota bacterium]|nr:hypothetical protein [Actinomycetota bacterium]
MCRQRGVSETFLGTIDTLADTDVDSFDTFLCLGANLGLVGHPERASVFFSALARLSSPDGRLVGTMLNPYATGVPAHLGDCAFTVAWMRPDTFRNVLNFESSWPQVRGANYEQLILETAPKPLRIFMHASTRAIGWWRAENNWFSSNLRVAAALAYRGCDLRLVLGDGPHDPNHAGVILPDALRWLWRRDIDST